MAKVTDMVLWDKPGEKVLLLGNQAIARGALEANVAVYAAYPGTPSSELTDTMAVVAERAGVYMEYSTNEKVAFETALAAAWSGLRAMTAMKHVGLNVAADTFLSSVGMGVEGGFVIMVADDPSMWSSQNEQDTRVYAKFANVPVLEPSSPQEAKDMAKYAFELSEKFKHFVILRTTTRSSHARGEVVLGELPEEIKAGKRKFGKFKKDPSRFVDVPSNARKFHPLVLEKIEKIREEFNEVPFNWIEGDENAKVGVIAPGLSYSYVKEALHWLGVENVRILKLGTPFPVPPYGLLEKFFDGLEKVLIVEELEPVVEEQVKTWAYDKGLRIPIHGKDLVPRVYEMTTRRAVEAIARFLGIETPLDYGELDAKYKKALELVPPRPPSLCPACPHRNSFYAIKKATRARGIYPSDIGCYTLGVLPPLNTVDTTVAMGGSIGIAHGLEIAQHGSLSEKERKKEKKVIVATIGDSTFFHTGLPALANAIYNRSNVLIVVLDNLVTAMTGDQPNPSTGRTPHGMGKRIPIEDVAKAMGADFVEVVDPYDIKRTYEVMKKALEVEGGVSVVVSRQVCALYKVGQMRRRGEKWPIYYVDEEACTGCKICINAYGCPAIYWDEEKKQARVEPSMCWGCGGCAQVCPFGAFKPVEEGEE